MRAIGDKSMMWRTTYAFGALAFAMMLAHLGFSFANGPQHGFVLRILASALLLSAGACVLSAVRELRGKKTGRSLQR